MAVFRVYYINIGSVRLQNDRI